MSAGPLALQPAPPDMLGALPNLMGPGAGMGGMPGGALGGGGMGGGGVAIPPPRAENFHHVAPPKRLRTSGSRARFLLMKRASGGLKLVFAAYVVCLFE